MNLVEQIAVFAGVFASGELVGAFFFAMLRHMLAKPEQETKPDRKKKELLKGIFERLVLLTGLLQGYPQVIIAFAALKIGTRLKKDDSEGSSASNDFFLIGNLLSIFIALIDSWFLMELFLPS